MNNVRQTRMKHEFVSFAIDIRPVVKVKYSSLGQSDVTDLVNLLHLVVIVV